MSKMIKITDDISYIPASSNPLSADIGIIWGKEHIWLFDVGNGLDLVTFIEKMPGNKNIVLSHFHPDHIANLEQIHYQDLYIGAHTYQYTHKGTIIKNKQSFHDGINLELFELPSSHAKGSLGLEVNGLYAFLGDGIYSTRKKGKTCYNANLLKEEIQILKALKAKYFLLSHDEKFIYPKEEIIQQLEKIYALRDPQTAYIFLDE